MRQAYETLMGAPPAPPKRPVARASPLAGLLQTTSVPTLLADAAALQLPGLGALGGVRVRVKVSQTSFLHRAVGSIFIRRRRE